MTTRSAIRPLAFAVAVIVFGGCGGSDDVGGAVTPDGTEFEVAVGDDFQIVMASNSTVIGRWEPAEALPADVVEFVGDSEQPADPDLADAPTRQILTFRGTGDGSAVVTLRYVTSSGDPVDSEDRARFPVTVGDGVRPPDGDASGDANGSVLTPAELLDRIAAGSVDGTVTVTAVLFDDGNGLVMCEALAESFPPQCPGRRVRIANPDVVRADYTIEGDIRWTDRAVTLRGSVDGNEFVVSVS